MGRAKGSQNKEQQKAPHTVEADQSSGQELLKSIEGSNVTGIPATA
jgi:hypothetical protein